MRCRGLVSNRPAIMAIRQRDSVAARGDGKILVDPRHFRNVLGSYPTGVSVITSVSAGGERWGLAVGTFTAISLDPPLVGFMPDKRSTAGRRSRRPARSASTSSRPPQLEMCQRFASRGGDKFEGMSHGHSPGGLPLLDDVLAWIECGIERVIELGDHVLVVGAVRAMERRTTERPCSSIAAAITRSTASTGISDPGVKDAGTLNGLAERQDRFQHFERRLADDSPAPPHQEDMAHDLGLLLDAVARERAARLEIIGVAAEGVAAQQQAGPV